MKTFKQFIESTLKEDVPTNAASGGAVAAIGVGAQGEPPGIPAKKRTKSIKTLMFKRKPPEVVSS